MTWQLTLIDDFQCSKEACLKLTHKKRQDHLRSWFGPFAQKLFHCIKSSISTPAELKPNKSLLIDKQFAQHILIQASFYHQRCLHQYQVNQDIGSKGIPFSHELGELLLYIRMTAQHPCQMTIQQLNNTQLPFCHDIKQALNTLLDARLIQQINYQQLSYYDKNPYPHDHILNLKTQTLSDYIGYESLEGPQIKVINKQHI